MATALTYEDLKKKTVAELRDIAKSVENHDAVQGYTQMNKDHLLPALCKALGIDIGHHHVEAGFDKSKIKARMKMLREERAKALAAHDSEKLKTVRNEVHALNHRLRAHMV
jgi:hypothetical protein